MICSSDNIFVGATITKEGKNFCVIKVNAKSFYATEMSYAEYTEKLNKKLKGVTFKSFCSVNNIKNYKYTDNFEIEENEFMRKDLAEKNSKSTYKLEIWEKQAIIDHIKTWLRKKGSVLFTPLLQPRGKKKIYFLGEDKNNYLIKIDDDYVLFSTETNEWLKVGTVFDYKYDHIPFELLSNKKAA